MDRRTDYQVRPFLEQYGFFILSRSCSSRPANSIGGRIISPDPRCALQPPGGRLGPASSGRTCGRASTPGERAALVAWTTPAQLALFDAMHVADRRHGLDVVASLRADGVTEPDVLVAGLLHDAGKGDTGVWPRVAYTLGPALRDMGLARRRRPARVRRGARAAADHAETSAGWRPRPAARPGRSS